ncbi:MAG: HDOD domain-containing protein [Cyanobacteria bacterium HKST-UBA04]|nr:HDOD domain-containing protein [Cyanobacteria bacterium HKST-UBA04]
MVVHSNPSHSAHNAQPPIDMERLLRRIRDIPSLPDLINKIVDLIGQPEASASQIAKLISFDAGLTSKVLRLVNSSAYGFQRQISSVQHAIMILGFGQVRGLVLSASILKLFEKTEARGLDLEWQWKHGLQTAAVSRHLAHKFNIPNGEDAFSAGLLHDIGKIVLSVYCNDVYGKLMTGCRQQTINTHGPAFSEAEQAVLGLTHARVGAEVAQRWKLPASFIDTIRHHHSPQLATDTPELVYVVALANCFCATDLTDVHPIDFDHIPDHIWLPVFEWMNAEMDPRQALEELYWDVKNEVGTWPDLNEF